MPAQILRALRVQFYQPTKLESRKAMRNSNRDVAGVQTLADVVASVNSCNDLSHSYRYELSMAVLGYCQKWLGVSDPAEVPADTTQIERHVEGLDHNAVGITRGWFQRRRRCLLSALRLAGAANQLGKTAHTSPEWAALLEYLNQLPKRPGKQHHIYTTRSALRPLFLYLSQRGLAPSDVKSSHITADYFATVAADASLTRQQSRAKITRTRCAWRLAKRHLPAWPPVDIPHPRPAPLDQLAWPLAAFSDSFQEDVKRYCAFRGQRLGDKVPPHAPLSRLERLRLARGSVPTWASPKSLRPLSETTLQQHVGWIRRAASALVRRGLYEIDEILSISDVATIDGAAAIVDEALGPDQPTTMTWRDVVANLRAIAIRWRGNDLPLDEIRQFDGLANELRVRSDLEMSERIKGRLRQFTPSALRAVSGFPREIFAEVECVHEQSDGGLVSFALARKALAAIAVMILLIFAPRRSTLLGTHFDRNFIWHEDGTATLFYRGSETKTGQPISAELDREDVWMLRVYEAACLPKRRKDPENRHLFPARKGPGTMTPLAFAAVVSEVLEIETGVSANLHLFRALLAQLLLSENPERNRHLVNSLLGHRIDSIADHRYSEFLTRWASGAVKEILARELSGSGASKLAPS